ncbi:MAG: transglutaminase domain-containing protein [Desulfobulbaceae bacterium]|nr:transglutaminase domain-containing protein [Desulfobulbaceae bacterium]
MRRLLTSALPWLLFLLLLAAQGCAARHPIDFTAFTDAEIPAAVQMWLAPGPQSLVSERIAREAGTIHGRNRRELVYLGLERVWTQFTFDRWQNEKMFVRSADDLFRERTLGGCADYALALVSLFRALQVPARLLVSAGVNWVAAYRDNPLSMPEGHVLVEVYLEDHWALVDPTYRLLYDQYDQRAAYLPRELLYCQRGVDYWAMGLNNVPRLQALLADCSERYQPTAYAPPEINALELGRMVE